MTAKVALLIDLNALPMPLPIVEVENAPDPDAPDPDIHDNECMDIFGQREIDQILGELAKTSSDQTEPTPGPSGGLNFSNMQLVKYGEIRPPLLSPKNIKLEKDGGVKTTVSATSCMTVALRKQDSDVFSDDSILKSSLSLPSTRARTVSDLEPKSSTVPSNLELNLKQLLEYVLERLTKDATVKGRFDPNDVQWTYKFFDSSQPKEMQSSGKRFFPLDLPTFEGFEKDLSKEFYAFFASEKAGGDGVGKLKHLSSAIKNIMSDVTWSSSSTPKRKNGGFSTTKEDEKNHKNVQRNYIYAFFRVPRSEDELLDFVGDYSGMAGSQNFMNAMLPKAFFTELHRKHHVRLSFVDMWHFYENWGLPSGSTWTPSSNYMKPIPNVLHYLGGGKVHSITKRKVEPELPPWIDILKGLLKSKSDSAPASKPIPEPKSASKAKKVAPEPLKAICGIPPPAGDSKKYSQLIMSNSKRLLRENSVLRSNSDLYDNETSNRRSRNLPPNHGNGTVAIPNTSYLQMNNPKKQILVPKSSGWGHSQLASAQRDHRQREHERADALQKVLGLPSPRRPTPKKVRRNLFSQHNDHQDIQNIQNMIALGLNSNFTRSPRTSQLFQSPGRMIPRPPRSPFTTMSNEAKLKVIKSKRKLEMDDEDGEGDGERDDRLSRTTAWKESHFDAAIAIDLSNSPAVQFKLPGNVICPESPATPPFKRTRRNLASSLASSEKKVVQESPESSLRKYQSSPSMRIDSASFYSMSRNESGAWEKSGHQLKAAKIKESVEMSQLAVAASGFEIQDAHAESLD